MTFEWVLELFHDYLQEDPCAEVVPTKWGYVRLFCEPPHWNAVEAVLCRTPAELFGELLELYLADQEYRMAESRGSLDQEGKAELDRLREAFQERLRKEEMKEKER